MLLPIMLSISILQDIEGSFISLKDYEFVGEDKRLTSLLAERMAVLEADVNLTDVSNDPNSAEEAITLHLTNVQLEPGLGRALYPSGETGVQANASLPPPTTQNLTASANFTAVRRALPVYTDPNIWDINNLLMSLMKQNIYMVQSRLAEIDAFIQKYETDERYRIAFIFNRMDEWKKDIRTILYAMRKNVPRNKRIRFKRLIYHYEYALKKDIDITYSVEFLIHLHSTFTKKMHELIPRKKLQNIQKMKQDHKKDQV